MVVDDGRLLFQENIVVVAVVLYCTVEREIAEAQELI